jgi:general nucleoside transport system ATP-binding protein
MKTVELEHISKHFGPLKANDNISFTFEAQKIYAILGENGAGKSTLMKILSGFQEPTSGQICIDAQPVRFENPNDAIHHGIGMLYQDPLDYAPLTALDNFIMGRPGGLTLHRRKASQEFEQLCRKLEFELKPYTAVRDMTIAERQQLEIIRLLSLGVRFLILDEPTTGISTERKNLLFDTLKSLARDDGMIIVLVSHKLEDVSALCDEVMVLRRGQLVGQGALPIPDTQLVEMMFGQYVEQQTTSSHTQPDETRLQIQHMDIHTPRFTIHGVSLTVRSGEVIGLAGLDGSGQVEFMQRIAGLERLTWPDYAFSVVVLVLGWLTLDHVLADSPTLLTLSHGLLLILLLPPLFLAVWRWQQQRTHRDTTPVVLDGKPIANRGYRELLQRGVVYLPSGRIEEGLVEGMTVVEHVALAERGRRPWVNWPGIWQRSKGMITHYNVKGRPFNAIEHLSGGNQQRVSLALLPENARLILMDTPTRGLDVESAQYIWSLLRQRCAEGTSIIFSSPDLDEILTYSDRVIVFSSGKAVVVDEPHNLTTDYLGELIGGKHLS